MDEKKILEENKYYVQDIYSTIDEIMVCYHLKKVKTGIYVGNGTQQDFAFFGNAILSLKDKQWFLPYVSKWLFYDGKCVEDVAQHYRNKFGIVA